MLSVVFDLETTGLPNVMPGPVRQRYSYREYKQYNLCRVVSMAWIVWDEDRDQILSQHHYLVKPEGFEVPASSTQIHGITHANAQEHGIPFETVIAKFEEDLVHAKRIVSHNIDFDVNVLKAELVRRSKQASVEAIERLDTCCTMQKGQVHMKSRKPPRLSELYAFLHPGEQLTGAHDALQDTLHCLACLKKLVQAEPNRAT